MTETEIIESLKYVLQPGVLTFSERDMVLSFQKYHAENGQLTELQERTLLSLKHFRERQDKHLY